MKINYVTGDDWQGLYVNGCLIEEGHTIRITDLLEILKDRKLLTFDYHEIDQNYLEDLGSLPDKFEDIDKSELL